MVTVEFVKEAFAPLVAGDPQTFFKNFVSEKLSATVMGHENPIAGYYTSREEAVSKSMIRVVSCLSGPPKRAIINILVHGDWATVEHTVDGTAKNGASFHQDFCWICRFE